MKERNDFEQWNDYVNSFERNEAWRMSLEIANMVLEAYFQSRDSFPGTSLMGEDLVDDSKTTDEIVEEVSTMMDIDKEIVAIWMRYHGFHIKTMEDGTVKWAIWRDMKPLLEPIGGTPRIPWSCACSSWGRRGSDRVRTHFLH